LDSSNWNYICYRRYIREPIMAVVKIATIRPELPAVIRIKNKTFKVKK
jgi:hypothetical protein